MSHDPMTVSLGVADAAHATEVAEAAQHSQELDAQHHLVAVFESAAHAQAAHDALAQQGIDPNAAHVIDHRREMRDMEQAALESHAWGAVQHLPLPHEDLHEYAKLVDEGYALLVVRGDAASGYHATGQLLERHDAIDFEAMLARWRNAGWVTPTQAAPAPVATPAEVPDSARMASILIQRGQGAAPQNQAPETPDGVFRQRPDVAAPDPVEATEAAPDYARPGHAEAPALPDTGPTRRERRLVREFVAHQAIADGSPAAPRPGPPIRVYRPHQA